MDRRPGAERRLTAGVAGVVADLVADVVADVQESLPGLDDLLPEPVAVVVGPDGGLLELLPGAGGWAGGHDLLWSVVGSYRMERPTDVGPALDVVRRRLTALLPGELVTFDRQLREALRLLDVAALEEQPVRVGGKVLPPGEDGFLRARCACVLAGRDAVAAALADPRTFCRFGPALAAEELLHLADEAHEARTGRRLP